MRVTAVIVVTVTRACCTVCCEGEVWLRVAHCTVDGLHTCIDAEPFVLTSFRLVRGIVLEQK